jgi:ribosomal protein L18
MQKEFEKHNKQNKTTAKSVGHGIANSITDKEVKQILSAYLCDNKIAKKTGNNH